MIPFSEPFKEEQKSPTLILCLHFLLLSFLKGNVYKNGSSSGEGRSWRRTRRERENEIFYCKRWLYCLLYCAIPFFLLPASSFIFASNRSKIIFQRRLLPCLSPSPHPCSLRVPISSLNTLLEKYCLGSCGMYIHRRWGKRWTGWCGRRAIKKKRNQ